MAATQPIYASDQVNLAAEVGRNISLADGMGLLLDADVGAGKTLDTMKAAVSTNASTKHAEFQGYVDRIKRALDYGAALSILTTANIQGVTTLDELIAITPATPGKFGPLMVE